MERDIDKLKEAFLFHCEVEHTPCCTVEYWCLKCDYIFPLDTQCDDDSNFVCSECGKIPYPDGVDGTAVGRKNLWEDRAKLDKILNELRG